MIDLLSFSGYCTVKLCLRKCEKDEVYLFTNFSHLGVAVQKMDKALHMISLVSIVHFFKTYPCFSSLCGIEHYPSLINPPLEGGQNLAK